MIISHHEKIKKTFTQFNEDVNRLAKAMYQDLGLKRGDVVGLWSCNNYNWVVPFRSGIAKSAHPVVVSVRSSSSMPVCGLGPFCARSTPSIK